MKSRKSRSGKSTTSNIRRGGLRKTGSTNRDAGKGVLDDDDNYLQGEYITNLQQQIYFLELELQVMKEKQTSKRFAGKALGTKFKKKIRTIEEETENLKKKNEELTMELARETSSNQELSENVRKYEQERESAHNSHLADKLKLEHNVEKLNEKLTEKNSLYETTSDKYREFRIESRTEIDTLKETIRCLKKDVANSTKQTNIYEENHKKIEIQLIECEESITLKSEDLTTLKNENFNFKDIIRGWELKYKKLEMDIAKENEVCTKYETENQDLRKHLSEFEEKVKEEENINKSENRWSSTIIELRTETNKKQNEVVMLNEKITDFESKINQFSEDKHRLNEQISDIKDKLCQSNEILLATNANLEKLEDTNLELRKDNIIKTDVIDRIDVEKENLQEKLNKFIQENEILQIEVKNLKQKLNISNKLENINLNEFKNLCSTNLRVADSIKTLMSTINQEKQGIDHENMIGIDHENIDHV